MAGWLEAFWRNEQTAGSRRDRRSGSYRTYEPDRLVGSALALDAATDALVAQAERAVLSLADDARELSGIARFLLRSEAIASSRIEGIQPSARQVALAELGQQEPVRGVSDPARLVANNMTVVREATSRLVELPSVTSADINALHQALLPDEPALHGVRAKQNWIGGSSWHPLDAAFVPPAPDRVQPLLEDLVAYLMGAAHSAVVQAALVHAQFETIHPFADGNGRVGRALIHTVFARRGLTGDAILPISLVLATLSERYVSGLTSYRHDAAPDSAAALAAKGEWISTFAEATIMASEQAHRIATEVRDARVQWDERLNAHREGKRALRKDSATFAILAELPATPVLTAATVTRIHGVSHPSANRALEELDAAGILSTTSIGAERRAYIAPDILELITWAERRIASTQFDTRLVPPGRATPAAPINR